MEVVVDISKFFQVEKAPIKSVRFDWSVCYTCTMDDVVFQKLSARSLMAFYPMPMKEAPVD